MEILERDLQDILLRFLPACPDRFCNDIDYTECILRAKQDTIIHMYDDEARTFFVFGYLSVFETQAEVDKQR